MADPVTVWRAHGLGNDYLVLETPVALDADRARALCDRHRGVGSDGVLEPGPTAQADFGVTIWNPDGSIAEKSGNGLRIFAHWLHHEQGAPRRFSVHTGAAGVGCEVLDDAIRVEMGRASQAPRDLPLDSPSPWTEHPLTLGTDPVRVTAVSLGNPHAVVFVEQGDLDAVPWQAWGAALETHPAFPNRTNVQIAHVDPVGRLSLRIWERGAGWTLASGSSACAVTVAACLTGRLQPGRHTAHMQGGTLSVQVSDDLDVVLEGPVAPVGRMHLDAGWVADHLG